MCAQPSKPFHIFQLKSHTNQTAMNISRSFEIELEILRMECRVVNSNFECCLWAKTFLQHDNKQKPKISCITSAAVKAKPIKRKIISLLYKHTYTQRHGSCDLNQMHFMQRCAFHVVEHRTHIERHGSSSTQCDCSRFAAQKVSLKTCFIIWCCNYSSYRVIYT